MGVLAGIYNGLFKRTSTFTLCICVGALGVRFYPHIYLNTYISCL